MNIPTIRYEVGQWVGTDESGRGWAARVEEIRIRYNSDYNITVYYALMFKPNVLFEYLEHEIYAIQCRFGDRL